MDTLVLLSGGVDSASCVAFYKRLGHNVSSVFVDYGQPVRDEERKSATAVAAHYAISLFTVHTSGPEISHAGEIIGRNAFLICTAVLFHPAHRGLLVLGIHQGTPYYDCSEAFAGDVGRIVDGCTNGKISLGTPFVKWTKQMVYEFALREQVPIDLTWSCEKGPTHACGHCLSCRDRETLHVRTSK
jgi:7-cyano-7-deazaguanine synthase